MATRQKVYLVETKNTMCVFDVESGEEIYMLHKNQKNSDGEVIERLSKAKASRILYKNYPEDKYQFVGKPKEISLLDEVTKDKEIEQSEIELPKSYTSELKAGTKIKDKTERMNYYSDLCLKISDNSHPDYAIAHRRYTSIEKQLELDYEKELINKEKHEADQYPPIELSETIQEDNKNVNVMRRPITVGKIVGSTLNLVNKSATTPIAVVGQVVENSGRILKNGTIRIGAEITCALRANYRLDRQATELLGRKVYELIGKDEVIANEKELVAKIANAPIEGPKALFRKVKSIKRPKVNLPKVEVKVVKETAVA